MSVVKQTLNSQKRTKKEIFNAKIFVYNQSEKEKRKLKI